MQLAEISFRFYRSIGRDGPMPENVAKEWDTLRQHVEETMQTEHKISANFEYKDLCKCLSFDKIAD